MKKYNQRERTKYKQTGNVSEKRYKGCPGKQRSNQQLNTNTTSTPIQNETTKDLD